MPRFSYSVAGLDETKAVKASLREVNISPKKARELARELVGMRLSEAKAYLEGVADKRVSVPYRRYKKEVGHRRGQRGFASGGYPVKPAKYMLKLLDQLEANADYKGLDVDRLRIVHASALRGRKIAKFIPRAFGRASPHMRELTHVEVVAEER
ncbi:MAG: 50S ribosomal protein L22 [Candidatus Brockarchaeota archaeon]|nr:50S ribosomal protein L22 [Candidatus Brockarchaeota archaeon]